MCSRAEDGSIQSLRHGVPNMTVDDFRQSLTAAKPPAELTLALVGLWWDAKGDWKRAHESAQQDEKPEGSWVHASPVDGAVRRDDGHGVDCAVGIHGRPGTRFVGEWAMAAPAWRSASASGASSLRCHRTVDWSIGHRTAL